ncbi:hypothetical protein D3C77_316870 [compost metagenome]
MQPAGYRIAMQPLQLVGNGLLGGQLDGLVDRRMQIITLLRSSQFRNARGHVTRVNRNAFVPVFATKLMLVLHFQSVEAHEFLGRILQPRVFNLRCHRFPNRIVPGHVQRGAELAQVADRLGGNPVFIVMANALLHDVNSRKLILPLQEISNLPVRQIDLNSARRKAVGSPVFQVHRIDDVIQRHRRSIWITVFIKGHLQRLCQSYGFGTVLFPPRRGLAVVLQQRDIQGLHRRGISQPLAFGRIDRSPRRRQRHILDSETGPLLSQCRALNKL